MNELCKQTATELAALIRKGDVSSREVVEAHLDRIEEVNGDINAITLTLTDSALAAADQADSASATERMRPLHGVPYTIKENIDCVGTPTTQGLPALAEAIPSSNAPIVERMNNAGAIPLARTNLPEMGSRIDTDNPLRGRTYNPWDRSRTPGGSSGGEGAAIATGMSPIGLGNDIGGSLRNPAYCCGIAALKPTVGRVPFVMEGGVASVGAGGEFLTDGPMARSVADLRLGLSILAGRHIKDPKSVDGPLTGPMPSVLKAGLVTSIPGTELATATVNEINRAGEILAAQGWEVETVEPPELDTVMDIWGKVLFSGMGDDFLSELGNLLTPELIEFMRQMGQHFDSGSVSLDDMLGERQRLRTIWSQFLTDNTVIIGPTWTNIPFPCDADLDPETGLATFIDMVRFIVPGNALGIPGLALPTGVADGLATGIQIYADLWREDLCLLAGECIERAVDTPTPIEPVK
ncbi:MAG: amidase family protein [Pseudomonadota bacterium]